MNLQHISTGQKGPAGTPLSLGAPQKLQVSWLQIGGPAQRYQDRREDGWLPTAPLREHCRLALPLQGW